MQDLTRRIGEADGLDRVAAPLTGAVKRLIPPGGVKDILSGVPLGDGKVDDETGCVQCPWHGSVFRLADGRVIHGPASIPQAAYEVRVHEGRIELRHRT